MTTREMLQKARALLVERGWHQGDYLDADGKCMCGSAAVYLAANVPMRPSADKSGQRWCPDLQARAAIPGHGVAYLALSLACGDQYHAWQDSPGRTLDEVLAVFDRAIEASR